MTVVQKTLQPMRLGVWETYSPVGDMYSQPETSIHIYGAFPIAVLSKTYSRVYQLKYEPT